MFASVLPISTLNKRKEVKIPILVNLKKKMWIRIGGGWESPKWIIIYFSIILYVLMVKKNPAKTDPKTAFFWAL